MIARYLCASLAVGALSFSHVFAQDAPESLLPAQRPASEVAPTPLPGVSQPAPEDTATDATPLPVQVEVPKPRPRRAPAGPRLPLGWLEPANGGLGADIWRGSNAKAVNGVLRTIRQPLSSRWMNVLLRRALVSRADDPQGASVGDIAATRALALLRVGEAHAAKRIMDRLGVERFTRLAYFVAPQAQLLAGDIPALCPITVTGPAVYRDPQWDLFSAICAALEGDAGQAALVLDDLREREAVDPVEIQLADQVATAVGGGGNRGVNVDWPQGPDAETYALTPYRLGMALAGRSELPANLRSRLGQAGYSWIARHAEAPVDLRFQAAPYALLAGALPLDDALGIWAQAAQANPDVLRADTAPARLRAVYVAPGARSKLATLRSFWGEPGAPGRIVRLLLSARAVASVTPADTDEAPDMVRALAFGGAWRQALRWGEAMGDGAHRVWPILAALNPRAPRTGAAFGDWADTLESAGDTGHRKALAAAVVAATAPDPFGDAARAMLDRGSVALAPTPLADVLSAATRRDRHGELIVRCARLFAAPRLDPSSVHAALAALNRAGYRVEAGLIGAELLIREGL